MSSQAPVYGYDVLTMRAMNSEIAVYASKGIGVEWQESMANWFSYFEEICSRFIADNPLSHFNHADLNRPIIVHPILYKVLSLSWELAKKTQFYFHPLVGTSMESIGYTHSFTPDFKPGLPNVLPNLSTIDEYSLIFDPVMKSVEKRSSYKLDLGGIGKGWSVEEAAKWLQHDLGIPSGMVDGGGDLYVWSTLEDDWVIGVEDPFLENEMILRLHIQTGAIATSNKRTRSWKQGETHRHHILDGRTGEPGISDIIQATVIGPSLSEAEVVAKVLCMHPYVDAPGWMAKHFPSLEYVLVRDNKEIYISSNLKDSEECV